MGTPLAQQRCEVCTPETPTLSRQQAEALLQEVPGWRLDTAEQPSIARTIKFKGFMPGVDLVNRIADVAEQEGHHPDLELSYGSLTVRLSTHAAGGLTRNDFVLAAKIDRITAS
jgi:4a-hydroxytetrahydrobiopterin dehydratase